MSNEICDDDYTGEVAFILPEKLSLFEDEFEGGVSLCAHKKSQPVYESSGEMVKDGVFFDLSRDEARRLAISIIEFLAVLNAKEIEKLRSAAKPPPPWQPDSTTRQGINVVLEQARKKKAADSVAQSWPECPF